MVLFLPSADQKCGDKGRRQRTDEDHAANQRRQHRFDRRISRMSGAMKRGCGGWSGSADRTARHVSNSSVPRASSDRRICGKNSHVNQESKKSGIVSHARHRYNFAMNAKSRTAKPASRQPNPAAKLPAPLARLLRPLVRLCISSGMPLPALAQLLRELFVNVAEHDFALEEKDQTDSRVSLLTGIHRKEVARLRGAGAPVNQAPATLSRTSAIIARWLAAPEFTDASGDPLPLPRTAGGEAPSFERLVASITKDVRPRAVL